MSSCSARKVKVETRTCGVKLCKSWKVLSLCHFHIFAQRSCLGAATECKAGVVEDFLIGIVLQYSEQRSLLTQLKFACGGIEVENMQTVERQVQKCHASYMSVSGE